RRRADLRVRAECDLDAVLHDRVREPVADDLPAAELEPRPGAVHDDAALLATVHVAVTDLDLRLAPQGLALRLPDHPTLGEESNAAVATGRAGDAHVADVHVVQGRARIVQVDAGENRPAVEDPVPAQIDDDARQDDADVVHEDRRGHRLTSHRAR